MSSAKLLPAGFESLEPFVEQWAVDGANNRANCRHLHSEEARFSFYAAIKDLVRPALEHLDSRPIAQHDASQQRLMKLLLSFAHVSLGVEVQKDHEEKHARLRRHLQITHATADNRPPQ